MASIYSAKDLIILLFVFFQTASLIWQNLWLLRSRFPKAHQQTVVCSSELFCQMLGRIQCLYALLLTVWNVSTKVHKNKKLTSLRNDGSQFSEYWDNLNTLSQEFFLKGRWAGKKKKKKLIHRHTQISDRLHTDAVSYTGSKRSIRNTSRSSCEGLVARPVQGCGYQSLRHRGGPDLTAHTAQPWTRALARQRERGKRVVAEGGRGGNLNFPLRKFVLACTTRSHAKRQWTVSLAICCSWSLKGFCKYSKICNSDHLRPSWH